MLRDADVSLGHNNIYYQVLFCYEYTQCNKIFHGLDVDTATLRLSSLSCNTLLPLLVQLLKELWLDIVQSV
jgi:hypothetical protein